VNSVQFCGGKSSEEQGSVCGHIAPAENDDPHTHCEKLLPSQSAYEIPVQPAQLSIAM
jgi:DNA topoisomerase VI subunit A